MNFLRAFLTTFWRHALSMIVGIGLGMAYATHQPSIGIIIGVFAIAVSLFTLVEIFIEAFEKRMMKE